MDDEIEKGNLAMQKAVGKSIKQMSYDRSEDTCIIITFDDDTRLIVYVDVWEPISVGWQGTNDRFE